MSRLTEGLSSLGFSSDSISALSQTMEAYIHELQLFNSAYNLVNTSDADELAVRHILDSLSAARLIHSLAEDAGCNAESTGIADIGSGGGLPGIPLAAAFPQYKFTLVERMDKRCAFLENCAAVLKLKNVTVLCSQAEQLPKEFCSIAVFRAFRPLDAHFAKTLLAAVKKGGYLAAYKAKRTAIEEEMAAVEKIIPDFKIETLSVPFLEDSERNLVIVQKN